MGSMDDMTIGKADSASDPATWRRLARECRDGIGLRDVADALDAAAEIHGRYTQERVEYIAATDRISALTDHCNKLEAMARLAADQRDIARVEVEQLEEQCAKWSGDFADLAAEADQLRARWEQTQHARLVAEMELRDARARVAELEAETLTEERVREVVSTEVTVAWADYDDGSLDRESMVDAIATRAAKELAGAVVACAQPTLTADEVRGLVADEFEAELKIRGYHGALGCNFAVVRDAIAARVAEKLAGRVVAEIRSMPPELGVSGFVAEMEEVLREARETCAVDKRGRNMELYFGDMMRRLEDAVDVVNDRITSRGGRTLAEIAASRPAVGQAQREADLRGAFLAGCKRVMGNIVAGQGPGFTWARPEPVDIEQWSAEYACSKAEGEK